MTLKLYSVDFRPMFPVPSGLIILASNEEEARDIANETLGQYGLKVRSIESLPMERGVVFYQSGEY